MKAQVTTIVNGRKYNFAFLIHCSMDQKDLRIEPEFYSTYSPTKQVPQGTHYEAEIVAHAFPDHPHWQRAHRHLSAKDQKHYVCWTKQICTPDRLVFMVRMWCLGTTLLLETGEDFVNLYEKFNLKEDDCLGMAKIMKEKYGITIPTDEFRFNN